MARCGGSERASSHHFGPRTETDSYISIPGVIQRIFSVIQRIFGVIQGTFGVIQGTFGVIQRTFSVIQRIFDYWIKLVLSQEP
jgi:phage-related protein